MESEYHNIILFFSWKSILNMHTATTISSMLVGRPNVISWAKINWFVNLYWANSFRANSNRANSSCANSSICLFHILLLLTECVVRRSFKLCQCLQTTTYTTPATHYAESQHDLNPNGTAAPPPYEIPLVSLCHIISPSTELFKTISNTYQCYPTLSTGLLFSRYRSRATDEQSYLFCHPSTEHHWCSSNY